MVAHNAAAAHGADAQFLRAALLAHSVAVIDILIFAASFLVDGICDHQSGSAGGIQLVVMVLLHNFDIKLAIKQLGRTAGQLDQHIYANRHIGAAEHRHLLAGLFHHSLVLFAQTGRAKHARHTMCRAELCRVHRTGRGSKINYDSLCLRQIFQRSVNRDIPDLTGFLVHTGNNAAIAAGRDLFHKGMAHTAVNALNNQIRHLNLVPSFSKAQARGAATNPRYCGPGRDYFISERRKPSSHFPGTAARQPKAPPEAGAMDPHSSPGGSLPI